MDKLRNLPAELRDRPQWIGYRLVPSTRPGKTDKIPINPHTGHNAKSTDPATWGAFAEAVAAVKRYKLAGVGFVFSADDPYSGVDLDDCIDAAGELAPWALAIVGRLDSYCERSQSGGGVHVIVRAVLPPAGRRKGHVEMYDEGRFFAITGDVIMDYAVIGERQAELEAIHTETFGATAPVNQTPRQAQPIAIGDADLLAKAEGARNGAKFTALWNGSIVGL